MISKDQYQKLMRWAQESTPNFWHWTFASNTALVHMKKGTPSSRWYCDVMNYRMTLRRRNHNTIRLPYQRWFVATTSEHGRNLVYSVDAWQAFMGCSCDTGYCTWCDNTETIDMLALLYWGTLACGNGNGPRRTHERSRTVIIRIWVQAT